MKTIAVMGHAGSGKTSTAIKKAISLGFPEILYVTDEINEYEFAIMLDRIYGKNVDFSSRDAVVADIMRVHYVGAHQPVPTHMYDVVIVDVHKKDIEKLFYPIIREALIVTKQLNRHDEVIAL